MCPRPAGACRGPVEVSGACKSARSAAACTVAARSSGASSPARPHALLASCSYRWCATVVAVSRVGSILKYAGCSEETFILALIYMDQVVQFNPEFVISSLNVHRLLITAIMVRRSAPLPVAWGVGVNVVPHNTLLRVGWRASTLAAPGA